VLTASQNPSPVCTPLWASMCVGRVMSAQRCSGMCVACPVVPQMKCPIIAMTSAADLKDIQRYYQKGFDLVGGVRCGG
jgi:hypothetical protein